MDKQTKIDECFKLFKLDSRASQKELELAYEVLTKGKNDVQLRAYRLAFEFLMADFYKVVDVKTEADTPEVQAKEDINTESKICIQSAPTPVRDAIVFANKEGIDLNDACTLSWATQNINLPMLFQNICTNCHEFFGIKWWTKNDILQIFKNCVINPLEYRTCTFELSATSLLSIEDARVFVSSLQELYKEDDYLCPRFDVKKTAMGSMGFVVVEKDLREHLVSMLHTKALQSFLTLNLVTPEE